MQYDIIGNLDGDVSFEKDYFEFLLGKFIDNSDLGVAGTPFVEGSSHYDYRFTNIEHVSVHANYSDVNVLKKLEDIFLSRGGGLTGLPLQQQG